MHADIAAVTHTDQGPKGRELLMKAHLPPSAQFLSGGQHLKMKACY